MTKPSVIRVVLEFYPMKGGSITHAIELSKKINPYLKNQTIIAPNFGEACKQFDEYFEVPIVRVKYPQWIKRLERIRVPVVPLILSIYAVNVSKQIVKFASNTDLIYVHGTLLGAILWFKLRIKGLHIPIVILQDSANLFRISKRSSLAANLAFALLRFSKPGCLIIVDDGADISESYNVCKKHHITYETVNHAIDTDFFNDRHVKSFNNTFAILSTQRLDPFRRVDLGILAFKRFLEYVDYPNNTKMIIVGDGTERAKLEELTKKEQIQKWVEFHGEKDINEVLNYLSTADVVVGTSLKTNLNLSIQEAMAYQKPVVVFDSGGTNRLIKNIENGILVKPGDINEFANKLKLLYENPRLRLKIGKNARETIIKEKSWDARIKKELEILSAVLNKP